MENNLDNTTAKVKPNLTTSNSSPESQPITRAQLVQITQELLKSPIAFHRVFARIGGGVTAGLLLSQAWYWTPRTTNPEKWFYKSQDEWEEETGLTRREQETARKKLIERGLIEEKRGNIRFHGMLHFRVNVEAVIEALLSVLEKNPAQTPVFSQNGGNVHSGMAETDKPECTKRAVENGGNVHSITETTSENTTENTHTTIARARASQPPVAGGVCVDEESSKEKRPTRVEFEQYARNNRDRSGATLGEGWIKTAMRSGEYDEQVRRWTREQNGGALNDQTVTKIEACQDCDSAGFTLESVLARAARKCLHPKLRQGSPAVQGIAQSRTVIN